MSAEDWDREAATFDDEPDHGLAAPEVREAWRALLVDLLPPAPGRVADLGSGTGSLSRLLVEEGWTVDGVDLSPEMVLRARAKVPGAAFIVADAADPPLPPRTYDAVLCRHVLWALPEPAAALKRWVALLRPGGSLLLVEGSWSTGAGLSAARTEELVRRVCGRVDVRHLRDRSYWGREVQDERYAVLGRLSP